MHELKTGQNGSGTKHDSGKPLVSLVPAEGIELVAQALTYGAKKYGVHNYRDGIALSRLEDAAYRHKLARMLGEQTDPESGLPHLAHEMASLMMLAWMERNRPDLDDRYKYESKT